jgi:hypothetical protein
MSNHEHGGNQPEGGSEISFDHPLERHPHIERNAHKYEESERRWETAQADKGFNQWLNGHPQYDYVDQKGDLSEKLKWYDFYKKTKETKDLLKKAFNDDLEELQGGRINIAASQQLFDDFEEDVEKVAQSQIVEGELNAMEKMERLHGMSKELSSLKDDHKSRGEKLSEYIEICFPLGESRKRFHQAVASLNDWSREQEAKVAAQKALEDAKKELQAAVQARSGVVNISKNLIGRIRGKIKGQAPGEDTLSSAKQKVSAAEQALRATDEAIKHRETNLHLEFGFEKHEMALNLRLVQKLHQEEENLKNLGAKIKTIRKQLMEMFDIGRGPVSGYVEEIEKIIEVNVDKKIETSKKAQAEAQPKQEPAPEPKIPDLTPGQAVVAARQLSKAVEEMGRKGIHYDNLSQEKLKELHHAALVEEKNNLIKELEGANFFEYVRKYKREVDAIIKKALGTDDAEAIRSAKVTIAGDLKEYLDNRPMMETSRKIKIRELVRALAPNGTHN